MMTLTEKLEELLQQKFEEPEFTHLFLVEIKQHPNNTVNVFIDSDTGVMFQHCVRISRYLENAIEEAGWLGEKYTLEVSSPGIDKPLTMRRQYQKNIGREVSVALLDDHVNAKGKLIELKEESLVLEYEDKVLVDGSKKKKKKVTLQREILFSNIKHTTVKISFK